MRKFATCILCEEECFSARARWPSGSLWAGQIRVVGKPCPGAARTTFELSDGSFCDVTTCADCRVGNENLEAAWLRACLGFRAELSPEMHDAIKKSYSEERLSKLRSGTLRAAHKIPLRVVRRETWQSVMERERGHGR